MQKITMKFSMHAVPWMRTSFLLMLKSGARIKMSFMKLSSVKMAGHAADPLSGRTGSPHTPRLCSLTLCRLSSRDEQGFTYFVLGMHLSRYNCIFFRFVPLKG